MSSSLTRAAPPPIRPGRGRATPPRRRPRPELVGPPRPTTSEAIARRLRGWFRPDHGRGARGRQSAGRVLGVMAAALLVAALVNADALVERAERKPLGPGRDRALAIWHPIQDVAHLLQLHRLRDLGDALAGDSEQQPTAPAAAQVPPEVDTRPRRPELRAPTAGAPLRLWVGGDSMVRDLSESVQRLTADDPRFDTTVHYEISTGLTRPDFFDWPAALASDMADTDAEVVVIMFGANDGQGLIAADGTTYQRVSDAGWQREYAARVAEVMDQLRADGRLVFWVTQPPMRDGDFDARMDILNGIYRDAARGRPWVELVDTAPLFGDANGQFADLLPGPGGDLQDLRQDDGIHLARAGADRLAAHVLGLVDHELDTLAVP